jgi:hypothetical protein
MVSRVMSAAVGAVLVVSACGVRMSQPAAGNPNVTRQDFTVFAPFSYRSELPRVSFYPRLAMPGKEVIVMARPIQGFSGETCLRIIDADAFAWHETCWQGGDSRRVTFRPVRTGPHIGYLAYADGDAWRTSAKDKAELCVLGGDDGSCP